MDGISLACANYSYLWDMQQEGRSRSGAHSVFEKMLLAGSLSPNSDSTRIARFPLDASSSSSIRSKDD